MKIITVSCYIINLYSTAMLDERNKLLLS